MFLNSSLHSGKEHLFAQTFFLLSRVLSRVRTVMSSVVQHTESTTSTVVAPIAAPAPAVVDDGGCAGGA
jgi:hypothetical protein